MATRLVLLTTVLCLALIGCKHRTIGYPAKRIANGTHVSRVAAGPPMAIRAGTSSHAAHRGIAGIPYALDSGDRVRVTVFGQENLSRIYPVDAGGFISMPLIGAVTARGATTFELEERIASALKRKYVKDPKVTVEVETNRPFFILGEVRNGGQFPYIADMTVQTAVAIAGGFTPRAKKSSVQLTRHVNGASVSRMVSMNWKIQPGDTITVKERFF